jgi:hypothetical protein
MGPHEPLIMQVPTASELIEALRPGGKGFPQLEGDSRWTGSESTFFRGQWSSDWPLVPSCLRARTLLWHQRQREWVKPSENPTQQIELEAATLWRFLSLCDDVGVALPEDGQTLR